MLTRMGYQYLDMSSRYICFKAVLSRFWVYLYAHVYIKYNLCMLKNVLLPPHVMSLCAFVCLFATCSQKCWDRDLSEVFMRVVPVQRKKCLNFGKRSR